MDKLSNNDLVLFMLDAYRALNATEGDIRDNYNRLFSLYRVEVLKRMQAFEPRTV